MAKVKKKAAGKKPAEDKGPKGVEMDFRIDDLTFSDETQPREGDGKSQHGLFADHVEDIRAAVRKRVPLPRVRIWRVAGKGNYITDGHHITEAYRLEGRKTVPALVFEGEWWQAVLDASAANAHEDGPRKLTHDDKRNAVKNVLKALKDSGQNWSNNRIAQHCRVSDDLVGTVIKATPSLKPEGKAVGADGKAYTERKPKEKKVEEPKPEGENRPSPTGTGATGAVPPTPSPTAAKPAEPARTFDFAAFEGKVGVLEREIDNLARIFGVMDKPRTEGIRKALRDFKAAFTIWHQELGRKASEK